MKRVFPIFLAALWGMATAFSQAALPEGPGKAAFEKTCGGCHALDRATSLKMTPSSWASTVEQMAKLGAEASPEELASITDYLSKNFGAPEGAAPAASSLPEGKGKDLIGMMCVGCHKPDNFSSYRHTPEEWAAILIRMGERVRVPNTKADLDEIAGYLAKNFPKVDDPNKINVNKAPAEEIVRLGFTPEEARRIVEFRGAHQPFATWGDLLIIYQVDGKKVKAAKDRIGF